MDTGLVDLSGYPIASLYLLARCEIDELFSTNFINRRKTLIKMGVPPKRIATVSPYMLTSQLMNELRGIPSDLSEGVNLPSIL